MRPFARLAVVLALISLAACQMQLPKTDAPTSDLTPLAPETITVTTLDNTPATSAKAATAAPNGSAPAVLAPAASAPATAIPVQVPSKTTPRPMPRPKTKPATPTPAAQQTAAPEAPPPPISPEQAICQKAGGQWSPVASSSGHICVHRTQDSGKSCRRKSDCQGECLAQSGTCAPITPLMGCNDIFQPDGSRMTVCLQ